MKKVIYQSEVELFDFFDFDDGAETIFRPQLGWFGTILIEWQLLNSDGVVQSENTLTLNVLPKTNEDQEFSLTKINFVDHFDGDLEKIILRQLPKKGVVKRLGAVKSIGDIVVINQEISDNKEVLSFKPLPNIYGKTVLKWSPNDDGTIITTTINITEDKAQDTASVWVPSLTLDEDAQFFITPNVTDPNIKQHTIDISDSGDQLQFILKDEYLNVLYDGANFPSVSENITYHNHYDGTHKLFLSRSEEAESMFVFNSDPNPFLVSIYNDKIGPYFLWAINHVAVTEGHKYTLSCDGCSQVSSSHREYPITINENKIFNFEVIRNSWLCNVR